MNAILNQYKVQFFTLVGFALGNNITSINDLLSQIIGDHYTIYDANSLLNGIDQVLNNTIPIIEFDTPSLQVAVVNSNITKLYEDFYSYENDNTIVPYYSLPTQDFQIIVQAWRNYLVQSPIKNKE
ncbi:hypothetical protein [Mucilaginibacter sp. NFX135]|uniref:hypothetical protein n=1 Tax=Mucilaginibacter sp. NFX135 TaxID=3402687 RepID=UPI003AFB05A5